MPEPAEAGARRSVGQFLSTDAGLTFFLVSLFLLVFVFYPLSEPGTIRQYLVDVFAVLVLISGVYAVSDRSRLVFWGVVALAALSFAGQLLPYAQLDRSTLLVDNATTMLFLIAVTAAVLYRVLREGPITAHRIQGAIAVYLMLGVIWAMAYSLVYVSDPSSFDLSRSIAGAEDLDGISTVGMSRLLYFSFVTMTTLGYGDIAPHGRLPENLAILQALTGQIYLVVILARLVSLAVLPTDRR